jgi:trimeric autotransporter adhesin
MKNLKMLMAGLFFLSSYLLHAQNAGIGTNTPNASAMLDIVSNSKGLLIPRLTEAQRNAITNPATGLLIFQTDNNPGFYYNNGLPAFPEWLQLSNSANSGWNLTGNSGTNPATNFIGTTDDNPLIFKIRNLHSGIIDSAFGNTGFGFKSLNITNTTLPGYFNTAVGFESLSSNATPGWYNTAVGYKSLSSNSIGLYNTALGTSALTDNTTGSGNTAVGTFSLTSNTTGTSNTASGLEALTFNTTGYDNTATGAAAMRTNSTGYFNTANGGKSLFFNSAGHDNTASGYASLYSNTFASFNTAHGAFALYKNTNGGQNVAVGYKALENNVSGFFNVAVGNGALGACVTGSNTAVGHESMALNSSGFQNTAQGYQSLYNNISGGSNVAIGFDALKFNSSGNNNIAIGRGAGSCSGFGSVNNSIIIGANTCTQLSNYALFGTSTTIWTGGNTTWSTYSDARLKKDIREDVGGLSFILKLRPVTYNRNISVMDKAQGRENAKDYPGRIDLEKIRFSGFLAQEVEIAAQQTGYNFSGVTAPKTATDFYSLSYESFVVPLVKAVQEQQVFIEKQSKLIDELLKRVAILESKK